MYRWKWFYKKLKYVAASVTDNNNDDDDDDTGSQQTLFICDARCPSRWTPMIGSNVMRCIILSGRPRRWSQRVLTNIYTGEEPKRPHSRRSAVVKGLKFVSGMSLCGMSLCLCAMLPPIILILFSALNFLKAVAIRGTCDNITRNGDERWWFRGIVKARKEVPWMVGMVSLEASILLPTAVVLYRSFATTVSQLKICDFSGETFKGFEVLWLSISATTTQLLSSGEFCKLRYDIITC